MGKYFGTDSLRGEANVDLTVEHAYKVGRFLGWCYGQRAPDERCRVVVGKDIRRNSYMFRCSLVAGLTVSGADVYLLHVATTSSVPYVVRTKGFNYGITISADHSPFRNNSTKVINERGEELEESVVLEIEKYLDGEAAGIPLAKREHISRTVDFTTGRDRYIGCLISMATRSFKNMKMVLDCSNGSTSAIAKNVFGALGAETHVVNNEPNRLNINMDCGSTYIEHLQKFVVDEKCNVGPTYDDDVNRCIAVNKNGCVVDGDSITYIYGEYMEEQGGLPNNMVVTTIMFNFGLYKTFDREGIAYVKTAVRNKYVHENVAATGHCPSGEQSSYIISSERAITGDGTLTPLKVTEVVLGEKQSLDKLASEMEICPQVLKNVRVKDKKTTQDGETVQAEVARATRSPGSDGRILLRRSGAGPVARVMMEVLDIQTCETCVDQVIQVMKDRGRYI